MLLRSALQSAGLEPSAVGYVEAHGTGTRLGDPIEAEALGEVFAGPREAPLRIGSVKTNLGHLEAAAGIAGLIKLVLALEHREIPAQLPVGPLSEHVRWSELPLEVATLAQPWTPIAGRRIGGVSAFGFSGTNAHVLVEEAPPLKPLQPGGYEHPGEVLALSAKSEGALERMIERYATHVESHPEQRWADVCHTAGAGRSHFRYRRAVAAQTADEGLQRLRAGAEASTSPSDRPRIGFFFGQQAAPLDATPARELYAGSSVFREVIDRCEQALQGHLEAPLGTVMRHEDQRAARLLHQPTYARAAEFALGCGLAAMWRDWRAEPAAFLGHGAGGWAAAVAREALPLEQAALLAITSSTPPMHEELLPQATLWIEMGLPSTSLEAPGNVPASPRCAPAPEPGPRSLRHLPKPTPQASMWTGPPGTATACAAASLSPATPSSASGTGSLPPLFRLRLPAWQAPALRPRTPRTIPCSAASCASQARVRATKNSCSYKQARLRPPEQTLIRIPIQTSTGSSNIASRATR